MLLYENAHRLVEMNAYKNFSLSLEGLKLTYENCYVIKSSTLIVGRIYVMHANIGNC